MVIRLGTEQIELVSGVGGLVVFSELTPISSGLNGYISPRQHYIAAESISTSGNGYGATLNITGAGPLKESQDLVAQISSQPSVIAENSTGFDISSPASCGDCTLKSLQTAQTT